MVYSSLVISGFPIWLFVEMSELTFHVMYSSFRNKGSVLFNDALNTFYLRLYGVRNMVKDHSACEEIRCRHIIHGLLFPINSKGSFICTIPQTG